MENQQELGPRPVVEPATRLSSARAAILAHLGRVGRPVTVKEIAADSGQHANTVREHLEALAEFGLVERGTAPPQGRGRPATTYVVAPDSDPLHGTREYAGLVDALATHLHATAPDPQAASIEAGRAWGRTLPAGTQTLDALENMGFAPETADGGLRLTRCPLLTSAKRNPEVVCNVHLGLLRELAGDDAELEAFVPGGCLVLLPPES